MSKLGSRRILLLVLFLAGSGVLSFAARQGIIEYGEWEFVNMMLYMLCGVLAIAVHFLRSNGRPWYFGLFGMSIFIIPFQDAGRLNTGLLFLTSSLVLVLIDTIACRACKLEQAEP